ncbi:MAG: hypothetical protein CSA62_02155 [Planctomycetota bacterium]|nr:MAG: hypothetical protein CSA62_02155 [Planctomycetota bacterium]
MLRLVVLLPLALSAQLLAQAGSPRAPDPLAGIEAELQQALGRLRIEKRELGQRQRPQDSFSFPLVFAAQQRPLELPQIAMGLRLRAQRFGRQPGADTALAAALGLVPQAALGQLWPEPGRKASAEVAWRSLLGKAAAAEDLPVPALSGRAAEGWRLLSLALAQLARAQRDSWAAPLSVAARQRAMELLPPLYCPSFARGAHGADARRSAQLEALRLDLESLGRHGLGALGLLRRAIGEFQAAKASELPPPIRVPGIQGDLLFHCETPLGEIAIGGRGHTSYERELFLVVDLGGDDRYCERVAGASELWQRPVSIAIDLDGRDCYWTDDALAFGAGLLGTGLLFDLGKDDDIYRCGDLGLGAGMLGLGLLFDDGGNDRYFGSSFALAAGSFGFGVLADAGGDDSYEVFACGQGFAAVRGIAVLLDADGDDSYLGRGRARPALGLPSLPGAAFCQGAASGDQRRGAAGGIALLWDGKGDDRYAAESFAQGCAQWLSLGLLIDESGHDRYESRQRAQGAGFRLASGMLWDLAGGDHYVLAQGLGQGAGYDLAFGLLLEQEGNDQYLGADLSQGAAGANGLGLLLEFAGDDLYAGVAQPGALVALQGAAAASRGYSSIAMLLDLAGEDTLSARGEGGEYLLRGERGLVWDRGYLPPLEHAPKAEPASSPAKLPLPEPLPTATESNFAELWRQAVAAASSAERDRARRTLLALGAPAGEWVLEHGLEGTGGEVLAALEVLCTGMGEALLPQLRGGLRAKSPVVRRNALRLLAAAKDLEAVPKMLELLEEDERAFVRRAAARALGRMGSEAALPGLERLARSEDALDRRAAAEALGGIPSKSALHRLADLLADKSYQVRDPARAALAVRKGDALEIGLQELARGKNPALREWLALFREWGAQEARPALGRLRLHSDPQVVREAREILELLDKKAEEGRDPGTEGKR